MYSQMSKCISLLSSAHTYTVHDSLHLHASNASHIFWNLEFLVVTSQWKVVNYVQLIRSDGTPPTQAPPSNSGCPLPPGAPCQSTFRLRTVRLDMR